MSKELTPKEKAAFESNPAFAKAVEESKQLLKKPTNDELLELYGLYKPGCDEDVRIYQDKNLPNNKVPGIFDLAAKYKLKAWEKVLEDGLTPEQAQERYIAKVEELKKKYGFDPEKTPEVVGSSRS